MIKFSDSRFQIAEIGQVADNRQTPARAVCHLTSAKFLPPDICSLLNISGGNF